MLCVPYTAYGNAKKTTPLFSELELDDFIEQAYTPTYDCPTAALNAQVDQALALGTLSTQQKLQLTSMQTHGLICASKFSEAQSALSRLLVNESANRSAKYYASAIFQYGFIYDFQEKAEACEYYLLARDSAQDTFSDVHLSASLGFISECMDANTEEKLFDLYKLVEATTKMNNPAALAHAYNRVGYFYAINGQPSLAAYQYQKAYDTAENIYTDENLLNLLGNLINSLRASDDVQGTRDALDKFASINARSGTSQTLALYYLHEAGYYVSIEDYEKLASTLTNWDSLADARRNIVYTGFYRWYSSALCYHKRDMQCLRDFIENEENESETHLNYFNNSKHYLKFIVDANLMLGDIEASKIAHNKYADKMQQIQRVMQNNNRAVDLAALHNKLINLEGSLREQEQKRNRIMWGLIGALLVVLFAVLWWVKHKYVESKSYDSGTGVLTNTAVIKKLVNTPKPSANCTNALAIFDIANFTEVNLTLGSTKSDFVLERIANTLKKITRSSDLLGRFGPEQFILCLVDIEEDAAQAFFERAKDALSNTFSDDNNKQSISVDSSMSIYYCSDTFDDINEILDNMLLSLSMKAEH